MVRLFIIILLAMSTLPLMAQDDTFTCNPSADHAISAREAANRNDFIEAITHYTCAIEYDPANATLFGARGLAYMLMGDNVSGVTDYQRYQDMTGELAPFMQAQIDRFFVTTPEFLQPVDSQAVIADTPQAYYERGLQYFQQSDYERAILDYNRAITLDPNNPVYYGARGLTYVYFGAPDFAVVDFQSYERLNGSMEPYMVQLLDAYADIIIESPPVVSQSVQNAPAVMIGNAESYYERGVFFQRNGEIERAILDFNVAISTDSQQAAYFAARGFAYVLLDEPALALRDYERYQSLTGNYAPFMQQQLPALQRMNADQASG